MVLRGTETCVVVAIDVAVVTKVVVDSCVVVYSDPLIETVLKDVETEVTVVASPHALVWTKGVTTVLVPTGFPLESRNTDV